MIKLKINKKIEENSNKEDDKDCRQRHRYKDLKNTSRPTLSIHFLFLMFIMHVSCAGAHVQRHDVHQLHTSSRSASVVGTSKPMDLEAKVAQGGSEKGGATRKQRNVKIWFSWRRNA